MGNCPSATVHLPIDSIGQIHNGSDMLTDALLSELKDYCRRTGFKASTVCVRALGDSRFVDRYRRRLERTARDAEKLRRYMAEHPPRDDAGKSEDAA